MSDRKKIVALCGPTAVGKTEYAIGLAREFNGEIVSCDSMQLYKYMDIGSAKPSADELKAARHHLVDEIDPRERFSAAEYEKRATAAIVDILGRERLPIIAGGTEAAVTPLAIGGFSNSKALSPAEDPMAASLPFDARRQGFVIAEGAGIVVLEEYEHAVARGARIYAEICGYGNTCDAYHYTAPCPDGSTPAKAFSQALTEAHYSTSDLLHINTHGTGTPLNDKSETAAIKLALGETEARRAILCSTKSMTGHALGAAGGIEAVAAVLALDNGIVPPTINYKEPDPECDLDVNPNSARKAALTIALSSSLGFGGHNAVLAFRRL